MSVESAESVKPSDESRWEPKIIGFCCNWCSYAGADLAGTSRLGYPANIRVIRVPCSGRVNPMFVLRAFHRGADGVLVAGCHPGDCHYATGNYFTRRRFLILRRLLEYVGIEPGRFHARWISGAEGPKFAQVCREITEQVRALGPYKSQLPLTATTLPTRPGATLPGARDALHKDEAAATREVEAR